MREVMNEPLASYAAAHRSGDLFADAPEDVSAKWHTLINGLSGLCQGDFGGLHSQLSHKVRDLGVAFRLTGENEERPWPLNPIPLLIGTQEWAKIERGLIQRADLLEHVVADIYGAQTLIRDGHLPALVVSGSRHFIRKMIGVPPKGGHHLHFYAVDLARGPNGEWRVLSDRVRLPTGIGYTLENRLALSRSTGTLLTQINTRRMASFFSGLRQGIARDCDRADPRIALLTPGQFNQSYPEQAHLSRYLGLPLVEGRDLVVTDNKLYVRTIEGLKRIDGLWRWIDSQDIDPLAFNSLSRIGVPDLFEAWSHGNLVVTNWPGAGVIESRAFSAFLPRLSRQLLNEPLILPNVATWWCGQPEEYRSVQTSIDNLVVSSAFGNAIDGLAEGRSRAGASLSVVEKCELFRAMALRPMDYTGQEIVRLSTTPSLVNGAFEPRPFTMRAFVARNENGEWTVMPGGFARLSTQGVLRTSLMGEGDISADVCIVDEIPVAQEIRLNSSQSPAIIRTSGILPSQAADNLYWFSRYCERTEMTVRVIHTLLGSSIDADGGGARGSGTTQRLVGMLARWGAINPTQKKLPVLEICNLALNNTGEIGSVASLIKTTRNICQGLRDRMALDFWRIANLPMPVVPNANVEAMSDVATRVIERMCSLSGLAAENMGRNTGWRFFDMGRRVERAINICRITRQLGHEDASADNLSVLLDLCDSQISYRTRYLVGPMRAPVLDMILLDPLNPRALAFQAGEIQAHLAALPPQRTDGMTDAPLRAAKSILARVDSLDADAITEPLMQELEVLLLTLSDSIAQRYFLQFEKSAKPITEALLG